MIQPPLTPNQNLKAQFIEFTYCNDICLQEATTRKIEKYDTPQQGWTVLPTIIITANIQGSIQNLRHRTIYIAKIPPTKILKLIETF